jgi:putative hemolysin
MNEIENAPSLIATVTRETPEVVEAQRLRYQVFAEEMGARLPSAAGKLDVDRHDAHCAHVLVREGRGGRVVACARLLDASDALAAGGFYSSQEFDLTRVLTAPGRLLEVGRTCVARDRRDGATLSALWTAIAKEAVSRGADRLIGCASVPFDRAARSRATPTPPAATRPCRPCWPRTCASARRSAASRRGTRSSASPTSS